jgi:hypothetical protein
VFKVFWPELAGDLNPNATEVSSVHKDARFKQRIHCKVRWFVVIKEGADFSCSCLSVLSILCNVNTTNLFRPIQTYGYQGVSKPNLLKSDHAIIYTSDEPPSALSVEQPQEGEQGMLQAIRVKPRDESDPMDPLSRVNFGKVYTVEHNVKVYDYGRVHKNDQHILEAQFQHVWSIQRNTQTTSEEEEGDYDDEQEEEAEEVGENRAAHRKKRRGAKGKRRKQ